MHLNFLANIRFVTVLSLPGMEEVMARTNVQVDRDKQSNNGESWKGQLRFSYDEAFLVRRKLPDFCKLRWTGWFT